VTDPTDADTDDDGLIDGAEDADHDGHVDAGETDPLNADTDGDGILDGTERGIVTPNKDTDVTKKHFVADADPSTVTDPTDADTDDDGLIDGAEDLDHDGEVDPRESDPNNPDTDGDGLLSFSDFCLGLSGIFRGSDAEVLRFAFRMYDAEREGSLSRQALAELLRGLMRQHGEAWGQRKWTTPLEELLDAILEPPEDAAAAESGSNEALPRNSSARAALLALRAEVRDLLTRYAAGRHLAVAEGGLSRAQHERLRAAVASLPPADPASAVLPFLEQPWEDVAAAQLFAHAPWKAFLASVAASIDTKPHTLERIDESAFIAAKPPIPKGTMAASEPPARNRSASPSRIILQASPLAWAEVAQAETGA
jgi:hypothetical protein